MTDGGLQTKKKPLVCAPEPLYSSAPMPMASPPFATPSYLMTPMPGPFAFTNKPANMSYATGTQATEAAKPPSPPPTLAEAKAKYAAEAKWGAPPKKEAPTESSPADTLTSKAPPKKAEQPNSSQADGQGQAKKADDEKKQGEGDGKDEEGSGGDSAAAPGADGKKEDDKKTKKGGPASAAEREKKFQEKQEDEALAIPFTPMLVPTIETGGKRLYPAIVQPPPGPYALNIPQKLDVKPSGDMRKVPAQLADYEQEFSSAAGNAKGLYNTIVAEGRDQTHLALQQLATMQTNAQSALDRNLASLDQRLEEDRKKLSIDENDAAHRIELMADTARIMVRLAASRVLGTVAARKAMIESRTREARDAAKGIHTTLEGYKGAIATSGAAASASFGKLAADPTKAFLTGKGSDAEAYDPEGSAAINETPMDKVIASRANNRASAFTNGATVFGKQIGSAIDNFKKGEVGAFAQFDSYIEMLGKTAPRQIAKMRADALKAIDRMEKRTQRTIVENRNRTEIGLVQKHKATRAQIIVQAQANQTAQARGIERNLSGQTRGYNALATSQGQSIFALQQQISGQKGQQPQAFAQFAKQAAKRTAATSQNMVAMRLAMMAMTAGKSRNSLIQRAGQSEAAQDNSTEKQIMQLKMLAEQAAASTMRGVIQQEIAMRQNAEPIARSVDNYKIPAAAEMEKMEAALWMALLEAQKQANQAYFGGGPPGKDGGESKEEAAPPGVGDLGYQFVEKANAGNTSPQSEEELVGRMKSIAGRVIKDFTGRGDKLKPQMSLTGNNPLETLNQVRGISGLRAAALIKYYQKAYGGDLISLGDHYIWYGNPLSARSTRYHYIDAYVNYLSGNTKAAAMSDMQAAVNYSNNDEQLIAAAKALAPTDMVELNKDPKMKAILDDVQGDLNDNHARALGLLREVTPENALEKVTAANAVLLTKKIETDLQENIDQERGADAVSKAMEQVRDGYGQKSNLEGKNEFNLIFASPLDEKDTKNKAKPLPKELRFADEKEQTAEVAKAWSKTVALLGTDGKVPSDGRPVGKEWLSQTLAKKRSYAVGDTVIEASLRSEQIKLITSIADLAPDDPQIKARKLVVEKTRPGGAKQDVVAAVMRNDAANTSLFNPDEKVTPDIQKNRDKQVAEANAREAEMLHYYDCFSKGIESEAEITKRKPGNTEAIKKQLGADLRKNSSDEREGKLMEMQVVKGVTDPEAAALAFEHAVDRVGTKEQLLKDTFASMSRDQIEKAVAKYDETHDPGLYERLGIFEEGQGTLDFPELSGDDAMDIQILAMGQPRNDRERFQKSRMTSLLQIKNASDNGKAFAGEEFGDLSKSHSGIMKKVGVTDASFNKFGELRRGTDNKYMGKWNSDGSFAPVGRDSPANTKPGAIMDSLMFDAALAHNEAAAENFKIAVDNIAGAITTAIIVVTAIITTAVTFGGAASFWIPMAITAAGGLAAMAVNASLKGGRYGYEEAFKDLGMTIVQTATAGLAAGLNVAATSGMSGLRTVLGSTMVKLAAGKGPSLLTEIGIGAATGAFGGAGNALFDDAAWDRGEWLSGIGHGFVKGAAGGAASAGIAGGLTRGAQAGAGRFGRFLGIRSALRSGVSDKAVVAASGMARAEAMQGSTALNLVTRTAGGGLGGAASRAVEIDYDRSRGRYAGTRAQAMDEIWAAGVQNAVQSMGEGIAEHGMSKSTTAGNMQRRHTDAIIISDGNGPATINRRPAANDNSDPAVRQLWKDYDQPRSTQKPPDAKTKASIEAEAVLGSKPLAKAPAPLTGTDEADPAQNIHPAANDNDPATDLNPNIVDFDADGNVTTRLPAADPDAEPFFPARSSLTDDAKAAALLQQNPDVDPTRVMNSFDPEKTQPIPKDIVDIAKQPNLSEQYQEQQKLAPRTLQGHIDSYDGAIGRRVYATADLSDRDLTRVGHMPENSRIMATNARDLDAAMHNYQKLMKHDRNREVMLIQDRVTGMYMVVQGGPKSVVVPTGDWNVVQHSHPRIISDNANSILIGSIPSGKPGDIYTVMVEVDALVAGAPDGMVISRSSVIDIETVDSKGNVSVYQTKFGVIGQGPDRGIWVEYRNPKNNNAVEQHSFRNLAEYEAHVLKLTGVDLTKQGADAVKTATSARTVRPAVAHGDGATPQLHADIDFVASRMAMHNDFDQQVKGLKQRGDLDPHLGRAATLEDAHARVKQMGLVGEPDSMIRLYNIINDESIPLPVRTMISDITLAATQRHMVETGQLQAGEPLIMLFHGATGARARDMTESGISMARKPGGEGDDFGEGLYFTQHLESARVYATGRGGTRQGADGAVIPYIVRGGDLGAVVNVRTGGQHRMAWEAFATANSHLFSKLNIDPDFMRLPSTMEALISGKPLPFGTFDAEGRGKVFNAFLESLGGPQARPDVIFGDLGGPLTSGVQFKGGVTDQAVVRSQRLADILNEQHMRRGGVAGGDEDAGTEVRSISGPEGESVSSTIKPTSEMADAVPKTLAQRLAALGESGADAVGKAAIENMRARASKSGDETGVMIRKLLELNHPLIMRVLLEPDGTVAQKMLQDFHQAILDRGTEPAIALRWMRSLEYLRIRGGARLQVEVAHRLQLAGLDDSVFDGLNSKQRRWVEESPVALALWRHDKALFRELHAGFMRGTGRKASGNTALHFDKYVRQRLQARAKAGNDPSIVPLFQNIESTRVKVLTEAAAMKLFLHGRAHVIAPLRPEVKTPPPVGAGIGAEIESFSQFKAGLRVVHSDPLLGRGTISALDGDNITFTDDATGKSHMFNVTEFHEQGFRLATHADAFFTDPLPLMRSQDEINAITKDIADFRSEAGLPEYVQGDKSTGTVAEIRMNGERFRGTNSGLQPENYHQSIEARRKLFERLRQAGLKSDLKDADLGDAEFISHAEADALLQAHMRFGALPEVVEIFVDRPTCNDCDGHLIELARMLGVKELRIYYKGEGARTTRVYR